MGKYDLPANVEKVLEVSGKEKVTLFGYSQGTASTTYSLATKQDYWADKANRFISLAHCVVVTDENADP